MTAYTDLTERVVKLLLLRFASTPQATAPSRAASDSPFSMGAAAVAERLAPRALSRRRCGVRATNVQVQQVQHCCIASMEHPFRASKAM